MKITYENGDQVRLRRVTDMDASDWCMEPDEYAALVKAQRDGQIFSILCEACEGYYDIKSDDYQFPAVSDYHFIPYTPDCSLEIMLDL